MRGGEYAADRYEIEISVEDTKTTYQDAGKVWCDRERRWKYGYKLLLLVNIAEGRERIVGIIFDKINVHETKMLKKMFGYIRHYVCPLEDMIKTLVVDRAYWDEKLMRYLKEEKGIDFVMLAKNNLCLVKDDLKGLIKLDYVDFRPYKIKNKKYYQRKTDSPRKNASKEKEYLDIELAIERKLDYKVFKEGYLNTVIRREKKKNGRYYYIFYVTSQEVKNPVTIVQKYQDRNTIENDVNRELDQRCFIRSLAGRTHNIMLARIMMVLKLFNCEKIMEMKVKDKYEEIKKRQKGKELHTFLTQENNVIVYVPEEEVFGVFGTIDYGKLVEARTKEGITRKLESTKETLTPEKIRSILFGQ